MAERITLQDPATCAHGAVEVHCGVGARCMVCGQWATFGGGSVLAEALDALEGLYAIGKQYLDNHGEATMRRTLAVLHKAGR